MEAVLDATTRASAYEDLFRRHFATLVRLAALLGADDPADVAQEAFVRLHRKGALRDDAAALPYLRRTVANLSRSRLRHLRVARRHDAAVREEHAASAEDAAVRDDERRRLLAALDRLPYRDREVLVLRYWSELSGPEIAATLGLPVGTVKSRTSRALAALAALMEA